MTFLDPSSSTEIKEEQSQQQVDSPLNLKDKMDLFPSGNEAESTEKEAPIETEKTEEQQPPESTEKEEPQKEESTEIQKEESKVQEEISKEESKVQEEISKEESKVQEEISKEESKVQEEISKEESTEISKEKSIEKEESTEISKEKSIEKEESKIDQDESNEKEKSKFDLDETNEPEDPSKEKGPSLNILKEAFHISEDPSNEPPVDDDNASPFSLSLSKDNKDEAPEKERSLEKINPDKSKEKVEMSPESSQKDIKSNKSIKNLEKEPSFITSVDSSKLRGNKEPKTIEEEEVIYSDDAIQEALEKFDKEKLLPPEGMYMQAVRYLRKKIDKYNEVEDYDSAKKTYILRKDLISKFQGFHEISNIPQIKERLAEAKAKRQQIEEVYCDKRNLIITTKEERVKDLDANCEDEKKNLEEELKREKTCIPFSKPSAQLLQMRQLQKQLALLSRFDEAKKVKQQADELQEKEAKDAELRFRLAADRAFKQTVEKKKKEKSFVVEKTSKKVVFLEKHKEREVYANESLQRSLEIKLKERPRIFPPVTPPTKPNLVRPQVAQSSKITRVPKGESLKISPSLIQQSISVAAKNNNPKEKCHRSERQLIHDFLEENKKQ